MGLLSRQSARELMARRSGAIVGVGVFHAAAVAGLLHMKYVERPEPVATAIQVMNLHVQQRMDEPAPDVRVDLIEPPRMEIVVPVVHIALETPPPTAITPPPPAPPASPVPQRAELVRDTSPVMLDISEVDVLKMPPLAYPRAAKQARVEGTVLVWALIGPDGEPREVRVHKTSGSEQLDRAGCDSVRDWQFRPHRPNGVAMSVQVIVPVTFELNRRMARNDREQRSRDRDHH